MEKTSSKFLLTFVVALFSLSMIFQQAHARTFQTDSKNVYNLDDETFKTSLRMGFATLTGTAKEIVNQGTYNENPLSKLVWEIKPQYMAGLGFSIQRQWVAIHGDVWIGITDGDSTMDDYDWLMAGPSWSDWSDWSHHNDTSVTSSNIFDFSAEFFIPRLSAEHFTVSVFLGYKYESFNWEARGGSYIYSENSFRDTSGQFPAGQLGISYEQTFSTPYIGFGLRGNFQNFEIFGRLIGSTFSQSEDDDLHHLRNLHITTDIEDGNMISFDIAANYKFLQHFSLELAYNYTSYDKMKGDATYTTVVNGADSSTIYVDAGSVELETSMISLFLNYSF